MRTRLMIVVLVALALPTLYAGAQEKKEESRKIPREATQVFQLKHAAAANVAHLLRAFDAGVFYDKQANAITASGSKETVAAIGEAIKKLDVPPPPTKNIDLTFQMLAASKKGTSDAALPDELAGVAKQLRQIFGYTNVELLETALIRTRDGSPTTDVSGTIPMFETGLPGITSTYELVVGNAQAIANGDGVRIRIDDLSFTLHFPYKTGPENFGSRQAGFSTSIDVREGQKAVVGKANVEGGTRDFILVVTARVVE